MGFYLSLSLSVCDEMCPRWMSKGFFVFFTSPPFLSPQGMSGHGLVHGF